MHSFADWRRLLGLQPVGSAGPCLAHTQWFGQTAPPAMNLSSDVKVFQITWEDKKEAWQEHNLAHLFLLCLLI
jgi:hypothetical protein